MIDIIISLVCLLVLLYCIILLIVSYYNVRIISFYYVTFIERLESRYPYGLE